MSTVELKRYHILPGQWVEFEAVWRRVLKLREAYGFKVMFALLDRETNWFTWAISHAGDFDAAAQRYYSDPKRIELDFIANYVSDHEIRKVEPQPFD